MLELRRPYLEREDRERRKTVAVLQRHDDPAVLKLVEVPAGKTTGMLDREWLRPHFGLEWHLQGFQEIGASEEFTNLVESMAAEIRWLSRALLQLRGEDYTRKKAPAAPEENP